ncbi:hypothetical protein FD754_005221 [Muntiacus muntjak]|uniref:Protein kinase domain-containing protein n=1 Tax=Muntiacus muntjak TaxID=9888 RepID=A0A5N3WK18_MUNMU|nr:hypothetical protein FD754_005221 [Muntiacus muntjak]
MVTRCWADGSQSGVYHSLHRIKSLFTAQGIEPWFPAVQADSLPSEPPGKPHMAMHTVFCSLTAALLKYLLPVHLNLHTYFLFISTQLSHLLMCAHVLSHFSCEILHSLGGIENLAQYMEIVAHGYLGYGEAQHSVDKLVNMTFIKGKIHIVGTQSQPSSCTGCSSGLKYVWVYTLGDSENTLVNLLSARDTNVLLGALLALASLAESPECREKISELNIVENLLMILHEYDLLSKRLTAELLRLLCAERQVREQVKLYEGVPVLLSLLHSDHLKLLWSVVWILVQICEDPETSVEIRIWGGIKQLLHILRGDRNFVSDRSSIGSLSSANAAGRIQQLHLSEDLSPREIQENTFSLQAACCAALTELVLDDTNAHQVVQENGIYTIAKLILPNKQKNAAKTNLLQCYAFRALRFLFSMERNRPLFKRLFPTDLFETFIDIGHYVRDISAYEELVSKLNLLVEDELKQIAENVESINQNKAPSKYIGNYAILDHLGSGAFGCVYKVRKRSGQNLLAMKEVNLHNPAFGKDKKDRDSSVRNIVSELTIIKEQLYHPNVVRYYKTFLENDRLYIVMELIEGAPLGEHFSSLKEKRHHFAEERLWKIFIQLCLALRYLHKEKRIIHRDLTPNNIMLGDKDRVTVKHFFINKGFYDYHMNTLLYCFDIYLSCLTFCDPMDYSTSGSFVLHYLPEACYISFKKYPNRSSFKIFSAKLLGNISRQETYPSATLSSRFNFLAFSSSPPAILQYIYSTVLKASQVALVVKNPFANAGNMKDLGGHGSLLQPGVLWFMGLQRLLPLQGIFLTQESNWGLLLCRQILYQLSYQESCLAWECVGHLFNKEFVLVIQAIRKLNYKKTNNPMEKRISSPGETQGTPEMAHPRNRAAGMGEAIRRTTKLGECARQAPGHQTEEAKINRGLTLEVTDPPRSQQVPEQDIPYKFSRNTGT